MSEDQVTTEKIKAWVAEAEAGYDAGAGGRGEVLNRCRLSPSD